MKQDKRFRQVVVAAAVIAAAALFAWAAAGFAHEKDRLRGEPFTDPSYRVPMPKEWVEKPVRYETGAEKADLTVVMDQDMYHALLPAIEKYAKETGLSISVKEGTCGISLGMLSNKTVDIGGFCCPPAKEDRFPGLKFHTLGVVAKAFFVNPDNPTAGLTVNELRKIYSGKITKWSAIKTPDGRPGPDRPIRAVARFHCQKRPGHWRLLMGSEDQFGPGVTEVGAIPDMIREVADHRDAIGWEVMGMAAHYKDKGPVKVLAINGHLPTDKGAVASLAYPFYRTYNLTTWEGRAANGKADGLVQYLIGEVGRLDPSLGLVPVPLLKKAGWKFLGDEVVGEPE